MHLGYMRLVSQRQERDVLVWWVDVSDMVCKFHYIVQISYQSLALSMLGEEKKQLHEFIGVS